MSDVVQALVDRYHETDATTRRIGREWYDDAREKCETIGAGVVPITIVARVMSILSPRVKWDWCIRWTELTVGSYLSGHVAPPAVSTKANRGKAWLELHGTDAISGPKTTTFVRAILGDIAAVVIDSWTLRTVGLRPDAKVTPHRQRWITAAYTEAAAIVGESPRDLQAILWCAIRGSHE